MTDVPAINEIVGYLEKTDPSSLEELRIQYPEQRDALLPGVVAGSIEEPALRMRAKAALRALIAARKGLKQAMPGAMSRLRSERRLAFWAQLAGLVGGSGAITAALMDARWGAGVSGAIALVGSLASAGKKLTGEVIDNSRDPASRFGDVSAAVGYMAAAASRIEEFIVELQVTLDAGGGNDVEDEVRRLIRESNELVGRLRALFLEFGAPA